MVITWERAGSAPVDAGLWRWGRIMRESCALLRRAPAAELTGVTRVLPRYGVDGEERFIRSVGERLAEEHGFGFEADFTPNTVGVRFYRLDGESVPRTRGMR